MDSKIWATSLLIKSIKHKSYIAKDSEFKIYAIIPKYIIPKVENIKFIVYLNNKKSNLVYLDLNVMNDKELKYILNLQNPTIADYNNPDIKAKLRLIDFKNIQSMICISDEDKNEVFNFLTKSKVTNG